MKRAILIFAPLSLLVLGLLWYFYIGNILTPSIRPFSEDTSSLRPKLELAPLVYEERVKKRPGKWGKDPFKTSTSEAEFTALKIEAISLDESGKPVVLIDGETYRENDLVGIYKIIKIDKDYLVVDKGGSNIIIRMER